MRGKPLAAIVSAGLSKFGKRTGVSGREMFAEAALEAFNRCPNLDPKKDIDVLIVGNMCESFEHQCHSAPIMSDWAGLLPTPALLLEPR